MAVTPTKLAVIVSLFGVLSFVAGIIAENKKPASGVPVAGNDVVICKYPTSDRTLLFGYLSSGFLLASTLFGFISLFYPYKGKKVPGLVLFRSGSFHTFFNIALLTAGVAAALLLWPTVTEHLHIVYNVHHNLQNDCPTAKTGLLGGGAFVSLDASLFWLVALMLADNAREDYLEDVEKDTAGEYGPIATNETA